MVLLQRKLYFPKDPKGAISGGGGGGGAAFSRGGGGSSFQGGGGVQKPIFYRNPSNL